MIEIKDADAYQKLAARTLISEPDAEYTPEELATSWRALTLAVSTGLIAEHVKKGVFPRHGVDAQRLTEELRTVTLDVKAFVRPVLDDSDMTIDGPAIMLIWNALGRAGEAGEVAGLIEKSAIS